MHLNTSIAPGHKRTQEPKDKRTPRSLKKTCKEKPRTLHVCSVRGLLDRWCPLTGSNRRPFAPEANALSTELRGRYKNGRQNGGHRVNMAPRAGLEPATTRLTAECSTIELSGNAVFRNALARNKDTLSQRAKQVLVVGILLQHISNTYEDYSSMKSLSLLEREG